MQKVNLGVATQPRASTVDMSKSGVFTIIFLGVPAGAGITALGVICREDVFI